MYSSSSSSSFSSSSSSSFSSSSYSSSFHKWKCLREGEDLLPPSPCRKLDVSLPLMPLPVGRERERQSFRGNVHSPRGREGERDMFKYLSLSSTSGNGGGERAEWGNLLLKFFFLSPPPSWIYGRGSNNSANSRRHLGEREKGRQEKEKSLLSRIDIC